MALHTELKIHKTARDLIAVSIEASRHMPRDFKGTLGTEIRKECVAIILRIIRANVAQDKVPHISQLLESVEVINTLMQVCLDAKLISPAIYGEATALTGSIGRQAGGWRNAARATAQAREKAAPASSLVTSPSRR
jgi:hypothetical protein